jgi:hypothetical protein
MSTVGSTLSSALSVFKGVGTGTLYELRRTGSYVKNLGAYSGVDINYPTLSSLVGLVHPAVQFPGVFMTNTQISPTNSSVSLGFDSAGSWGGWEQGTETYGGTWKLTGSASDYDIKFDVTSGNNPTGGSDSIGTWLNLGTTRTWYLVETGDGYYSKALTANISIRSALSPYDVLVSNVGVTMEAVVEV